MKERHITCIQCPMGCQLTITIDGDIDEATGLVKPGATVTVTGNTCPRGEEYGIKEVTAPTRIVTTTVDVEGGELARVSVKTASDIPKERVFDVVNAIKSIKVSAPVNIGDVIVPDVAGTGVDVVATKNVGACA